METTHWSDQPADAQAVVGDLRYRTKGATLLWALVVARKMGDGEGTTSNIFLFRTTKGHYFRQTDRYDYASNYSGSEIMPLSIGDAVRSFEGFPAYQVIGFSAAFPSGIEEA